MFACTACLRRAAHNLAADYLPAPTSIIHLGHQSRRRTKTTHFTANLAAKARGHATYESLARGHHKRLLRKALKDATAVPGSKISRLPPPNARRKGPGAMTKGEIKDAMARDRNRANNLVIKDDAEDGKAQLKLKREVENWHRDPVQLASQVQRQLRIPDFRAALNLVRASEGIVANNVVSWNHLVDFWMAQGDPDKGWKVYNEMKKRGHRPDAHTYTIMLRGLSANARKKDSAERAVGIYNSMFAPNSAVVPNTIHTNAVLNVCARTGDMDSMWAIAGKLPVSGAGAPDRWTFTTILNAIKDDATSKIARLLAKPDQESTGGLTVSQSQDMIFEEALKDARKLWSDVSHRWRRADMVVDEHLVCAMGRLILGCGSQKDFPEVFDLVEQTMNVRLKERKPSNALEDGSTLAEDAAAASALDSQDPAGEAVIESTEMSVENPSLLPLDESVVYAQPSNHTLSMLMEAALGSKQLQLGKSYWHLLTTANGPFKVKPDAASAISYLRVLRVSRSSRAALDLLNQTWPLPVAEKLYRRGTFVIAMSTCIRDKNNPSVFETADKLLLLMQEKLEEQSLRMYSQEDVETEMSFKERRVKRREELANLDESTFGEEEAQADLQRTKSSIESLSVDPKALKMYVDLALITTKGWNEGLAHRGDMYDEVVRGEGVKFERDSKKNNILKALRRIGPQLPIISRLAKLKVEEVELASLPRPKSNLHAPWNRTGVKEKFSTGQVGERLEDLIDLLRTIVGAYDRVIMMADRFEDEDLPQLDERMMRQFREAKRAVSGFLSRTNAAVAKVRARKYQYSQFRNRAEDQEDEEDEDVSNELEGSRAERRMDSAANFSPLGSSGQPSRPERQIARHVRQVYEDTDRDLNRSRSLSRRQRNERKKGVTERMRRRDLASKDIGIVNENLEIEDRYEVEQRMRERAFGINIDMHANTVREGSVGASDKHGFDMINSARHGM